MKDKKEVKIEEISFGLIMGTITGLFIGLIIGVGTIMLSADNDKEEKDCVIFYKDNNYITEQCEKYKEKLEKSKK